MKLQHIDINASRKSYAHLAANQLLVTKIFYTIQGEGPFAGRPALFIRLAGCNRGAKAGMGCEFCDTSFALARGVPMTFDEIVGKSMALIDTTRRPGRGPMIVITGGEPMLQDNLSGFIDRVIDGGWDDTVGATLVQIESNGDRLLPTFSSFPEEDVCLVVSPKVSGKPYRYRELSEDVLAATRALKFVISGDPLSPYYDVPAWARDPGMPPIYISPLTSYRRKVNSSADERASMWNRSLINIQETRVNYARAKELSLAYGYNISLQTHLFLEAE